MNSVRTGLDAMAHSGFAALRGRRVGVVCHPASVDSQLRHVVDLMTDAGIRIEAIFGPEHGLLGQAQDLIGVEPVECGRSTPACRVHSLYGQSAESLRPTPEQLDGLDALVIDLQDVGTRFYTFQATMLYCLQAALRLGVEVFVPDRPNPLGGTAVEGPRLTPECTSFVGAHDIAVRHGLTMGELARLYVREFGLPAGGLRIAPCVGWSRRQLFPETGLPWVLPSPNMPTADTALVYPGQCLLEGTNLSEGRGTTRPFEICGAPWLDAREFAARLTEENLPGVVFRPLSFRPTFQKHAGVDCGGVQLHVGDPSVFRPVRTSLALLAVARELSGAAFAWRTEVYEFVSDPIAIDLLFGSPREREALERGDDWREIASAWLADEAAFAGRARSVWLYE